VAARCKSLTRVNIYKNRVKLSAGLPILPNREALQVQLMPSYYTLGSIGRDKARSRPLYSITDDQKHAAEEFLKVIHMPSFRWTSLDDQKRDVALLRLPEVAAIKTRRMLLRVASE